MPADRTLLLVPGRRGLNLRDHPSMLAADELADSLNWQIEERGSLIRRLGYSQWSTDITPDDILSLGRYRVSGGLNYLVAHCADGSLQTTLDGSLWTEIAVAGTFSTTQPVAYVQYLDRLYISDGSNPVQEWDGTTMTAITATNDVQTITITGTPTGGTFTISYGGVTSGAIAYNANASTVQTALQAMTTIGSGNVSCSGGALPGTPVVCTFVGSLAATPISLMSADGSALTGGTSPTVSVAHTTMGLGEFPRGKYLASWRGHVFVSGISTEPRTVRWSKIFDPRDWSVTDNNVLFPDAEQITAIYPSPPSSASADGIDGLLVFKPRSTYRIYDASDNEGGVVTGGSYQLVDRGAGCYSYRTITPIAGELYLLGEAGVYRTTGHSPLVPVSRKVERLFRSALTTGILDVSASAAAYKGRYYLSLPANGSLSNNLLMELYLDMPADQEAQHPWMAHSIAASSIVVFPAGDGDIFLGADARSGAGQKVRQLFSDTSDAAVDDTDTAITAYAKTGGLSFDVTEAKRMKRIEMRGRGTVYVSVSADFEDTIGEQGVFQMPSSTLVWDPVTRVWGVGVWGPGGGDQTARARYTKRGSFFTLDIRSSGQEAGTSERFLGLSALDQGGAAVHSLKTTFTPLDTW